MNKTKAGLKNSPAQTRKKPARPPRTSQRLFLQIDEYDMDILDIQCKDVPTGSMGHYER